MNLAQLLGSTDLIVTIIGAVLAFLFGLIASYLTQLLLDRRQKLQLTYSRKIETPLILAKEELKNKLRVTYLGTEITDLYLSNLRIVNSGKKPIKNQYFTCLFPENASTLDPVFPQISTLPPREVGPIRLDSSASKPNEFRFIIENIGPGQMINITFLTTNNKSTDFQAIFREDNDVSIIEGDVSSIPNLEFHVYSFITGLIVYVAFCIGMSIIPIIGSGIGAIIGLPFLLGSLRSLKPIIAAWIREHEMERNIHSTTIHGDVSGPVLSGQFSGTVDVALPVPILEKSSVRQDS